VASSRHTPSAAGFFAGRGDERSGVAAAGNVLNHPHICDWQSLSGPCLVEVLKCNGSWKLFRGNHCNTSAGRQLARRLAGSVTIAADSLHRWKRGGRIVIG
jgi:hypothetical protein